MITEFIASGPPFTAVFVFAKTRNEVQRFGQKRREKRDRK